jgi:hypothetical protein
MALEANKLLDMTKKMHAKEAEVKAADDWGWSPPGGKHGGEEMGPGAFTDWGVPNFDG